MKTEQEILDEIKANERTIENYQQAYSDNKIPFEVLKTEHISTTATIQTLKWVLGENDRYD